ncbi:hypothetical protein ES319_A11G261300v1 [Gossypium barbadense]|uniref:Rapid ALkalinization Factor n=1 Tax=Gossypium barbadense TaxID=3634 RepID=A0A5J5TSL7_GOSBA|nr:hypothetical protein ES319_A11G261300v1 [Gossypium barbadense]
MGVEKKIMVLWVCAMLVSSILMEEGANAEEISNGAMGKNLEQPCKQGMGNCVPKPSSGYNRGCEEVERCRHGP